MKTVINRVVGLALTVGALAVQPVLAFDYIEAIGGDLSDDLFSPTMLGNLANGANTITGTFRPGFQELIGGNGDAAQVVVPAGLTLLSISAVITDFAATGGSEQFYTSYGTGGPLFQDILIGNGAFSFSPARLAELQAQGTFTVGMRDFIRGPDEGGWNYAITIQTSGASVPDAGSTGLLGLLALFPVAALRRFGRN